MFREPVDGSPAVNDQQTSQAALLDFQQVTKFYGAVIGVNHISFALAPGITGLIGANGAGKSTLIKLASGQLRPSVGAVRIAGQAAWSTAAKRQLGYCPDIDRFYEEMTGRAFVCAMARLYGYARREAYERAERALEMVGMQDRASRRLAGCSHGMRQRIKLAQALVHDPRLLLLDEPLAGIDPGGRRDINRLLDTLAAQGKTIVVSSHLLSEVDEICESILMLARGRLVAAGALPEVRSLIEHRPRTVEIVAEPARKLAGLLAQSTELQSLEIRHDQLTVRTANALELFARVSELALAEDIAIRRLQTLDDGAEAVFEYLQ